MKNIIKITLVMAISTLKVIMKHNLKALFITALLTEHKAHNRNTDQTHRALLKH
jgi:hypothetical protein